MLGKRTVNWYCIERIHDNDCWVIPIAIVQNSNYEAARKSFKDRILGNGSSHGDLTAKYLFEQGFSNKVPGRKANLRKVIKKYSRSKNELIIQVEGHVLYMHKNNVFDNRDHTFIQEYLKEQVFEIFLREVDFRSKVKTKDIMNILKNIKYREYKVHV